jgi:hypothetical protein
MDFLSSVIHPLLESKQLDIVVTFATATSSMIRRSFREITLHLTAEQFAPLQRWRD